MAPSSYKDQLVVRVVNPPASIVDEAANGKVDVWSHNSNSIDIRLRAADVASKLSGIEHHVLIPDLAALILADSSSQRVKSVARASREAATAAAVPTDITYFNDYHPYAEVVDYLRTKCSQYAAICAFTPSIGKTVEGRDIVAVKLGNLSSIPANTKRPQLYMEGTLHAREWAATSTVQYIFHQLLEQYATSTEVKALVDSADIHFVPLANPDGYEYSWSTDRLWRKNRRANADGSFGVDLNRNMAYHWGQRGTSSDPTSEVYSGPKPESEPEVQAILKYFRSLPHVVATIDMHTYGQLLLRPVGDTKKDVKHEAQLRSVTEKMRDTIRSVTGTEYEPKKGMQLYPTTGTARDTFYTTPKTDALTGKAIQPYSVTIELRPSGAEDYGFVLPKEQIIDVGKEIFASYLLYAKNALASPLVS
ncbi:hypothetical protein BCR44DRAFT_177852 [Catenaria anguillulae PL171]|uniref:Peptidase M14 domain-containing protein n=1 Tax=Catenaria anguillulae PL171 TaxID=765915 RepID=A0A1Y2HZB3_9FUNG|nr:hypothetical protein BCR44DRAFT_177852 [Catenaria anguillulae PL171]